MKTVPVSAVFAWNVTAEIGMQSKPQILRVTVNTLAVLVYDNYIINWSWSFTNKNSNEVQTVIYFIGVILFPGSAPELLVNWIIYQGP